MNYSLTDYHAKYFAYELTKRCSSDKLEKLASTFAGVRVDLNPHQVDAALFAFKSPLSKGALLADEVGLGKTIEAGLVISQKWAERKKKILVIAPANLRKQWYQELTGKFFLPCEILEKQSYDRFLKEEDTAPFMRKNAAVIICSYQFARSKEADVRSVDWDLVVIDEAHRLRNVYKPSNVVAKALKNALHDRNKLLLTATPLQNSLLELFGLVSFIDDRVFGNLKGFRERFAKLDQSHDFDILKERLKPICHRTLRADVAAYVNFTKRHAMLEEFEPTEEEQNLYQLVSDYLQRDNLQALPASQRILTTLIMRKLLASSSFAIAGTLASLANRLKAKLNQKKTAKTLLDELDEDYESLSETMDELGEDENVAPFTEVDRMAIEQEIADLESFATLAESIENDAKGETLLKALGKAFQAASGHGGAKKAIIFTESRRTQEYLQRLLSTSTWGGEILLFNGTNNDDRSKEIYKTWCKQYAGTDRVTGSKTADMRSALVDYFAAEGTIMIATEAAAEGINLQFCSLIVNYDLPWNPQRIEQRIGRCHRYGQKHDVVVVNFLNQKNEADRRVYELLNEKFQLFEGVFGSSDEVLGAIESGVDFEKRIAEIYQKCRQPAEIDAAFHELRQKLSPEIDKTMLQTRQKLLDNFDDEVREKLHSTEQKTKAALSRFERMLLQLTRRELAGSIEWLNDNSFRLQQPPSEILREHQGLYELPRHSDHAKAYRAEHPLAEELIERAKKRSLPVVTLEFNYSGYEGKISPLESLVGQQGSMCLSHFQVVALKQEEDYLIFAAVQDDGTLLEKEVVQRFFDLEARELLISASIHRNLLESQTQSQTAVVLEEVSQRNAAFFEEEAKKLDGWAEDQKMTLEGDLKDLDRQIKEAKRSATAAVDLPAKLAGQKEVRKLEKQRSDKRRSLFEAQDEVDRQRDDLIAKLEGQLEQQSSLECLFEIRWSLV